MFEAINILVELLVKIYFVIIILALIYYILGSIGLMKIADRTGEERSWMAWVPVLNIYLLGKLGFSNVVGWVMVVLFLLNGNKTTSNSMFSLALSVLTIISFHKIYSKVSDKAVIMTVFTVLSLGLLGPIFLFMIRNNDRIV